MDLEERLAAWEAELREKYTEKERQEMAKSGEAMPDGSYPIRDREDVENAIRTVGLGNDASAAIRRHIIDRAKAVGASDLIPDEWKADGSKRFARNAALTAPRERRRKERRRAISLLPEVRYFDPSRVEVRTMDSDGNFELSGQPIMYGAEYRVVDPWGEFVERIHFGSLTDPLTRGVDTRLLFNHGGMPMARTARPDHPGTMKVWDTPESLRFKAELEARMQLANDFYYAIRRGDIDQMSVGMIVGDDDWGFEGSTETRDIFGIVDLPDISGVTYPCSPTTSIEVAQRMALEVPVESRARLRRVYADLRAGRSVTPERAEGLRVLLDTALDTEDDSLTLDELVEEARAGKVLSSANQAKLSAAHEAIAAVLDAAKPATQDQSPSEDDERDVVRHPDGTEDAPDPVTNPDATMGGTSPGDSSPGSEGVLDATGSRSKSSQAQATREWFERRKQRRR